MRIVGRERECALLDDRLADATGSVVLIGGEPGVGKTRLAEEVSAHAKARGLTVAWGRASEGSPPYWPWRQVLRRLGLPDLTATVEERFVLFESVASQLAARTVDNGLLIVLDDLQWADPASLRLLAHVATGIADAPMMVPSPASAWRRSWTAGSARVTGTRQPPSPRRQRRPPNGSAWCRSPAA